MVENKNKLIQIVSWLVTLRLFAISTTSDSSTSKYNRCMINRGTNHIAVNCSPHSSDTSTSGSEVVKFPVSAEASTEEGLLHPPPRLYTAPRSSLQRKSRQTLTASGHMTTAEDEASRQGVDNIKDKDEAASWKSFQNSIRFASGSRSTDIAQSSLHSSSSNPRRVLFRSLSDDSGAPTSLLLQNNSCHSIEGVTPSALTPYGAGSQRPRRGMRRGDFSVAVSKHDSSECVNGQPGSQFKRFLRSVSWDGHERGGGMRPDPFSETPADATMQAGEAAWKDEKLILLKNIQQLTKQAEAANSQLKRVADDPNLVDKLTSQLSLSREDQVALQTQLEIMQGLLKERDQELTALRLESLERHLSTENASFSTNPRWDRAEDHSSSAAVTVSTEDYRSLHTQRDTAMLRAGELAHKLAQAQSQVDDLQERLSTTNLLLETLKAEASEWKSRFCKLEALMEEKNHKIVSSNNYGLSPVDDSSIVASVATQSRGIGGIFSRANDAKNFLSVETPTFIGYSTSGSIDSAPSSNFGCESEVVSSQSQVRIQCTQVEEQKGASEALAAELWKLKQQVLHLQEEKSACLSALVSSQNELATLANHVNTCLPNK